MLLTAIETPALERKLVIKEEGRQRSGELDWTMRKPGLSESGGWTMYADPLPIFTLNRSPQTFTYLGIITQNPFPLHSSKLMDELSFLWWKTKLLYKELDKYKINKIWKIFSIFFKPSLLTHIFSVQHFRIHGQCRESESALSMQL